VQLKFFILITNYLILLFFNGCGFNQKTVRHYGWHTEIGSPKGNFLVRGMKTDEISQDMNRLILALNRSEKVPLLKDRGHEADAPLPVLVFQKISKNTAYIKIVNDFYLTQQMGTTGADAFLAKATFTLTEYEGVDSVYFIFEEGDHAIPGKYSREDFKERWKIK